jgi:hypothetical protein
MRKQFNFFWLKLAYALHANKGGGCFEGAHWFCYPTKQGGEAYSLLLFAYAPLNSAGAGGNAPLNSAGAGANANACPISKERAQGGRGELALVPRNHNAVWMMGYAKNVRAAQVGS